MEELGLEGKIILVQILKKWSGKWCNALDGSKWWQLASSCDLCVPFEYEVGNVWLYWLKK